MDAFRSVTNYMRIIVNIKCTVVYISLYIYIYI